MMKIVFVEPRKLKWSYCIVTHSQSDLIKQILKCHGTNAVSVTCLNSVSDLL